MKHTKWLAPVCALLLLVAVSLLILPGEAAAANEVGFAYEELHDGTVRLLGIVGELAKGQNLVIPSTINGKPVSCIKGDYGYPYRWAEDLIDFGPDFGSVTLPSINCRLEGASFIGFSGTLVIPESIDISGGFVAPTISELVFAGYRELTSKVFSPMALYRCDTVRLPEGTVTIDAGIGSIFEHIYLPSTFRAFTGNSVPGNMTLYLYKYQRNLLETECPTADECEYHRHDLDACKFYYFDDGDIPVEGISLDISNRKQRIFAGWECEVLIETDPINANEKYTIELSSDNEAVASVCGNKVTANEMGYANITVKVKNFVETFSIQVYGISIISESNNVQADNMAGSFDLGNNAGNGAMLKFIAEKISASSWNDMNKIQALVSDFLKMDAAFQNVYDLSVQFIHDGETTNVQPKEGKFIRICIPVDQVSLTEGSRLMHIADDGTVSELQFARVKKDGKEYIQFDTPHFSTFAFVDKPDPCANGHTEVVDKAVGATCLTDGLTAGKHCSVCNTVIVKQETVPATGHTWNSGRITQEASCAKAGEKTYTCLNCGKTKKEELPKLTEHAWNKGAVTKEPTCQDKGVKTFTCVDCEATRTEDIAKLTDHSYDNGKVTKNPTCKAEGVKTFTCSGCGDSKTEAIAKISDHSFDKGTLNGDGTITHTCTNCGETKVEGTPTAAPTTVPQATAAPTTVSPTTVAPTTVPVPTFVPTTTPATVAPTTEPETTAAPTTTPVETAVPTTVPETTAPITAAPTQPAQTPDEPASPVPVIIAVVCVLALGGGGIYLWFFQKAWLLKLLAKFTKK